MKKNSQAGFSLIELLAAFLILSIAYVALIHFYSLSLHIFSNAKNLFNAFTKLELFIEGEEIPGISVSSHTFKVKGYTVNEKTYTITYDNVTAYFRIYK